MRDWIVSAIIIVTLFIVGCGIKSEHTKENKGTDEKTMEVTKKEPEEMKDSKIEAVHLGKSLYLILGDEKLDENHLLELDTGAEAFSVGAVVTFDMVERMEGIPAKAKAKNIEISDGKEATNLKITFELAYAIKDFLGEKAALVDVRTPEEYAAGYVKQAELIPLDEIGEKAANRFEKEDVITVYCRSGNRSATAQAVLEQEGYLVLDIGGISDYKGELEQ